MLPEDLENDDPTDLEGLGHGLSILRMDVLNRALRACQGEQLLPTDDSLEMRAPLLGQVRRAEADKDWLKSIY